MLREAISASNGDARLDDTDTVPDDARLAAELEGAPPEVRAAAVMRSLRIPEPSIMRAAWVSLPLDVRDRIGGMALTQSFYSFTADWDPQALTLKAGRRCERWHSEALNGITTVASAHHLRAELELAAALVLDSEDPTRVARAEAEEQAHRGVIAAPLRDRTDLVACVSAWNKGSDSLSLMPAALRLRISMMEPQHAPSLPVIEPRTRWIYRRSSRHRHQPDRSGY